MNHSFLAEAEAEDLEAVAFFEEKRAGLGRVSSQSSNASFNSRSNGHVRGKWFIHLASAVSAAGDFRSPSSSGHFRPGRRPQLSRTTAGAQGIGSSASGSNPSVEPKAHSCVVHFPHALCAFGSAHPFRWAS